MIHAARHELGCHGHTHRPVGNLTPRELRSDVRQGREVLRDITGIVVDTYRAPGFSVTPGCRWALDVLVEEGFVFDSSIDPALVAITPSPTGTGVATSDTWWMNRSPATSAAGSARGSSRGSRNRSAERVRGRRAACARSPLRSPAVTRLLSRPFGTGFGRPGSRIARNANSPVTAISRWLIVATAYFAYSARLMGRIAEAIGRDGEAARYRGLAERVRAAWQAE